MPEPTTQRYPRLLIVHLNYLSPSDQGGVSIRNWYANWPRENLAQVYSGGDAAGEPFCGQVYRLGAQDRRLGRLFTRLKGSGMGVGSQAVEAGAADRAALRLGTAALLRYRLSRLLVNSGLWEQIFTPRLSEGLLDFVRNFHPDWIYAQGYTLTFARLAVMLKKHFDLPMVFQTGDDWPRFLYQDSILKPWIRPQVERAARELTGQAVIRFTNGPRMAEEYAKRYGGEFTPLMMCDDFERFERAAARRTAPAGTIQVVYSGTLAHGRWQSILDLAEAARILAKDGLRMEIAAYVRSLPPEALDLAERYPGIIRVFPPPDNADVPALFKGADLLFLPETFDPIEADKIRLSISTKAHLYMMSQRPVLVYGSAQAGVVDYARRCGWGHVVDRRDPVGLAAAVKMLVDDPAYASRLMEAGRRTALQEHNAPTIRSTLKARLQTVRSELVNS